MQLLKDVFILLQTTSLKTKHVYFKLWNKIYSHNIIKWLHIQSNFIASIPSDSFNGRIRCFTSHWRWSPAWRWHALPLLIDTHGWIVPVDSVKAIASVYLIQDWLEITAPDKDRNCHIASSIGVDVRLGII